MEFSMEYFPYSETEINYLKSKDLILGNEIDKIGIIKRAINTDLFSSLVESIVGQQISSAAAKTVNARLLDKARDYKAESIFALGINEIQSCGLSFRKATYIYEICEKVINKELDLESLQQLNDDDVIKELVKLKGIGKWTAEMLMIFSMKRPNILSFDDLAIHRGMRMLYQLESIDKLTFENYRQLYSPFASTASLYLWEISSGKYGHVDPKVKI